MALNINEEFIYVNKAVRYFDPPQKGWLHRDERKLKAVDEVSFNIKKGEVFGLVGESGCGKSTLGRCIISLIPLTEGAIFYKGKNIHDAKNPANIDSMQMIFQNPFSSLNPRHSIRQTLMEVAKVKKICRGHELERIKEILQLVGLNEEMLDKYPYQFSGGQLQRIAIARSLLVEPEFIVADEAVSALDVSVQAQILNLFTKLKNELALTILFISHNLSVVEHISDRVAVMYLGKIMEIAPVEAIYKKALHPYTQAIIAAVPIADPTKQDGFFEGVLEGDIPNPVDIPTGCRFAGRCKYCMDICREKQPLLWETKEDPSHAVACHLINPPL